MIFRLLIITILTIGIGGLDHAWAAGLKLRELCRVKGQETNTLQGLGLVVGLRGTGDNDALPTSRALARAMQLMGGSMSVDRAGQLNLEDVADAKNVAMVFVTATVPSTGAQAGDQLDVSINAISAKSLDGGTLLLTPLLGPRTDNPTVYAMASGTLKTTLDQAPTTATIEGGAKMESTIHASFEKDGKLTLILEQDFASFENAQRIEDEINNLSSLTIGQDFGNDFRRGPSENRSPGEASRSSPQMARAIDQLHVEVAIPPLYSDNPIKFIALLLDTTVQISGRSNRVVINERDGVVVIGKDVEIAPVLITHRNMRIEAGGGGFVPVGEDIDPDQNAKLKSLADSLNALDVPTSDLIVIIKTLKRKGDLYGEVIFE